MTFNFAMQAIPDDNSAAKTFTCWRQVGTPHCIPRPQRRGRPCRRPTFPGLCRLVLGRIPGLKVVMPNLAADVKCSMKSAIRDPNPGNLPRKPNLDGKVLNSEALLLDRAHRQGPHRARRKHVTIVSFGIGMTYSLAAADKLAAEGIEAEVIDLRTFAPWLWPLLLRA